MEQVCISTGAAVVFGIPMIYAAGVIFAAVLGGIALLMVAAEEKSKQKK